MPLKLEVDGRIRAVGSTIFHVSSAWLAHIIVDKGFRGRGLGRAMTEALIERARNHGAKSIQLVATEMGEPLYKKLGFRNTGEYTFMKGGRTTTIPEGSVPYQARYREQLFALDQRASGEYRQQLLEPHLNNAQLLVENRLLGFHMPTLGEGLIVAETEVAGHALMRQKHSREWLYTAVPRDNTSALNLLKNLGHQEYRVGKRMLLGPDVCWRPEMIFGRIGGNLG